MFRNKIVSHLHISGLAILTKLLNICDNFFFVVSTCINNFSFVSMPIEVLWILCHLFHLTHVQIIDNASVHNICSEWLAVSMYVLQLTNKQLEFKMQNKVILTLLAQSKPVPSWARTESTAGSSLHLTAKNNRHSKLSTVKNHRVKLKH